MGYKAQATKFFQEIEISAPLAVHSPLLMVHGALIEMSLRQ